MNGHGGGRGAGAAPDRGRRRGVRAWLMVQGDRRLVAGILASALFAALLLPSILDPDLLPGALADEDPVETLFQALVAGIVTGVTLVVTIAQVVLSQELGAVGDQRERMRGALAFRDDLEDTAGGGVSPTDPAAFLAWLARAVGERAGRVAASVRPGAGRGIRSWVEDYSGRVRSESGALRRRLEGAEFGTFAVTDAALGFGYASKIHLGRRLRAEHGDALEPEGEAALEETLTLLSFFGVAREHVKTLYFQWELSQLSRSISILALPALAATIATLLHLDRGASGGAPVLGLDPRVWLVCAAAVAALSPFLLLLSYILRIVTVTRRTLAAGPFTLRSEDRDPDLGRRLDALAAPSEDG